MSGHLLLACKHSKQKIEKRFDVLSFPACMQAAMKNSDQPDETQVPNTEPKSIQSKGGDARAKSLTAKKRSEIARGAAFAKHEKSSGSHPLPKATHEATLELGGVEIDCAVLDDGTRVLSRAGFVRAIGRTGKVKGGEAYSPESKLPVFLAAENLKPFITSELVGNSNRVIYKDRNGGTASGFKAELLAVVCELFLTARAARDEGGKPILRKNQEHIALQCELLMRGFARLGITALVDEATGYQYERPRRDLEEQLKRFMSEELRRWVRTFPAEYFKQLCRLRGVEMRADMKLPQYFGTLTNNLVYRRIAPGLLKKLKERRDDRGSKSNKIFQWLSEDVGLRALLVHLGTVIGFMKCNISYEAFEKQLNMVAPTYPEYPGLFDDPKDWEAPE